MLSICGFPPLTWSDYLPPSEYLPAAKLTPLLLQPQPWYRDLTIFYPFELVLLLSLLQAEESELNEHHSEQLVAYMRYNLQPPNTDVHIQSQFCSFSDISPAKVRQVPEVPVSPISASGCEGEQINFHQYS